MQKSVIIVAGGSGKRMKSKVPKQFMLLANKPVLMYTINAFYEYDAGIEIILVLSEADITEWQSLCKQYHFSITHKICAGGDQRFHSVKNGLAHLTHTGLVAIHDGVRPLVSKETMNACFTLAEKSGNAIPTIPLVDSIRQITDSGNQLFDRNILRSIQTPQVFNVSEIKTAYKQNYHSSFTDDASVLEKSGHKINLCEGNWENIKITRPVDLIFAEAVLNS